MPIWHSKTETARRVKGRISSIMRWDIVQGYRDDNPAGDAVAAALPKNGGPQKHLPALPHQEVAGALATVRESGASSAAKLAFEFQVLTASRSGEVREARWSEVDIEGRVWVVPAQRMKAKREHRVPLSTRAVQVLGEALSLSGQQRVDLSVADRPQAAEQQYSAEAAPRAEHTGGPAWLSLIVPRLVRGVHGRSAGGCRGSACAEGVDRLSL